MESSSRPGTLDRAPVGAGGRGAGTRGRRPSFAACWGHPSLALLCGVVGPIASFKVGGRFLDFGPEDVYPFVGVCLLAMLAWGALALAALLDVVSFARERWARVAAFLSGTLTLGAVASLPAGLFCACASLWPLAAIVQELFSPSERMAAGAH